MKKEIFYKIIILELVLLAVSAGYLNYAWGQNNQNLLPKNQELASGNFATTTILPKFFINNYESWPSGQYVNDPTSIMAILKLFNNNDVPNEFEPPHHHFMDINGDSLMDILYYFVNYSSNEMYAVLINNGQNNFTAAYKCFYDPNYHLYYGDCASSSPGSGIGNVFNNMGESSGQYRTDDYMRYVLEFSTLTSTGTNNPAISYQFLDFNGDGLTDIIYSKSYYYSYNSTISASHALLLNNGENSFELTYRCVETVSMWSGISYSGDCAQQ